MVRCARLRARASNHPSRLARQRAGLAPQDDGDTLIDWRHASPSLLLHEPAKVLRARLPRIDVPGSVDCDPFQGADVDRFGNERAELSLLRIADPDPLLESRIGLVARLRVGHIDGVVLVDEDAARPPELFPFG